MHKGLNMLYPSSPKRLLAGRMTLGSHHHLRICWLDHHGSRFQKLRSRARVRVPAASYGTKASRRGPGPLDPENTSCAGKRYGSKVGIPPALGTDRDHPLWNRRLFGRLFGPTNPKNAEEAATGADGQHRWHRRGTRQRREGSSDRTGLSTGHLRRHNSPHGCLPAVSAR